MRFRYVILVHLLLALTVTLCLRTFISILIVLMVRAPSLIANSTLELDDGLLDWSLEWKGYVLAIPMLGCAVALPLYSFFLAQKYSPKRIVLVVIIIQSLLSFLSPIVASFSLPAFLLLRFVLGLAEGCVMPALNTIAAAWFPPMERVTMVAIYTCGFQLAFGGVQYLISFLNGQFAFSWPVYFYAGGVVGLLFCSVWMVFVSDSPSESRFIGSEEKREILGHIPKSAGGKQPKTPWKKIFSSPVILTHLLCMSGFYFAIGITSNLLPLYFTEELGMAISKARNQIIRTRRKNTDSILQMGYFTFVPFLCQIISKFVVGSIVDWLKKNKGLSHTAAAKWCQTIGSIGSALALFALPFCHFNHWVAFAALVFYGATFSLCVCGFYTSMTMIAPKYTGTITSLVTFVGMVVCLLSILVFNLFVSLGTDRKFFFLFGIAGILQILGGVAYILWGTANVQPWASLPTLPNAVVMKPLLKDTKVAVRT